MIKTKDIAAGAMMCAVYGLLLMANTMTGLGVEGYFPFLFGLPLMVYMLNPKYSAAAGWVVFLSMVVLTFLLSSITTWLNALAILSGTYLITLSTRKGKNVLGGFLLGWTAVAVVNWLSMTVLASIFGYDLNEDIELFKSLSWLASPSTLILLVSVVIGFMEAMTIYLFEKVLCMKMHRPSPKLRISASMQKAGAIGWLACLLGLVLIDSLPVLKCPVICREILITLAVLLTIWMDVCGLKASLAWLQSRSRNLSKARLGAFLLTVAAFVPPFNLVLVIAGLFVSLKPGPEGKSSYEKI